MNKERVKLNIVEDDVLINDNRYLQKIKLGLHEYAFLGKSAPFIQKPNNDMRINNKYISLEEIGKQIGISKNIVTRTVRNLESVNLIRLVYGGNQPPIIYFNPDIFYINKETSIETKKLFAEPIEKVKNNKYYLEKELELELIENLNVIEEGLTLINNQYPVEDGYIDILARDIKGILCIIELKVVDNDSKIVEQCVYYPSQFDEKVRMITIAPGYKNKLLYCLRNLGVEIKVYKRANDKLILNNLI